MQNARAPTGFRSDRLIAALLVLLGHGLGAPAIHAQFFDPDPAWGEPQGTLYGQWSLSVAGVGDVNGDGFDDVLVGGPFYFTPCCPSTNQQGGVLLYYGSEFGLSSAYQWYEIGSDRGTTLGHRVAGAGDVNGDGFDDLLFNSGSDGSIPGGTHQVHVRYGSAAGPSATWDFDDGSSYLSLGPSVAGGGDVNGDGYDDVLAGFSRVDGVGVVRVFHGSSSGLPLVPDWDKSGSVQNGRFGQLVTFAGDVNGDGYDDVLVCDDPTGGTLATVELYYGSAAGLASVPAWKYRTDVSPYDGKPISGVGDLNQDGFDDFAIGLSAFIHDDNRRGAVLVFLGAADRPASEPDRTLLGEANFGFAVVSPGDVNLDGYDDLGVGAPEPDSPRSEVHLFLGGPSGVAPVPAWTANPAPGAEDLGWWIDAAGDVNGDGRPDLVAGDPNAEAYFFGRASVFLGAAVSSGPASRLDPAGPGALTVDLVGSEVELRWGVSCSGPAEDYAVYAGTLGSFTSHTPLTCSTSSAATWRAPADPGDAYFLVVPRSADHEGSYGAASNGQRPVSDAACLPQWVASCR